jgi:pimeloyl-ACP methyl ester carboxylesterase
MSVSRTSQVLFLHGGPGLSAELERRQFGTSLPVRWWDQPHFETEQSGAFDRLVDAALNELSRLHDLEEKPVALLASSFGVHVALALIERVPAKIGHLSIVGGTLDLRMALVCLGLRVAEQNHDLSLAATSQSARQSTNSETLWALINRLFSVTNLFDFYWSPTAAAQRAAMNELAAKGTLFHLTTYQAVLNDFFTRSAPRPTEWRGSANVLIGRHDPYALPNDAESWRGVLPQASVQFVEAGHFPHLELPPSVWMPEV